MTDSDSNLIERRLWGPSCHLHNILYLHNIQTSIMRKNYQVNYSISLDKMQFLDNQYW